MAGVSAGVVACSRSRLSPILLGQGRLFFDGLEPEHVERERGRTLEAPNV
jgi:hypothetical protein